MSMKNDHKMWGAAPMTAPGVHCDIRPYEKSVHLLVCSPAKRVFFTEFRQTLSFHAFFQKNKGDN
jgi:hypothetical protein